jgi:hypothetical protein
MNRFVVFLLGLISGILLLLIKDQLKENRQQAADEFDEARENA